MQEYILFSYLKIIFLIIPVWLTGLIIFKLVVKEQRLELTIPAGFILGITFFVFLLNSLSFVFIPPISILLAYFVVIFIGIFLAIFYRITNWGVPIGKMLYLWISSLSIWGFLLGWKSNFALIGSDTNLYYSVASTFVRGNFPPLTPWQPDLPLAYHLGVSELLGAFHFLTGLDFKFLHIFFAFFFIFCSSQIIIWILKGHESLMTFLLSNLAVAVSFISFGFVYITWPISPLQIPKITSINDLVLYLRELPTVNQSIEVYGAPVNLDGLIYFVFHAFGLAIFLSLLAIVMHIKKETFGGWLIICIGLASLALVSESIFIAAFPALVLGMFLVEKKMGNLSKNFKKILILLSLTVLVVFYQGGVISASIKPSSNIEFSAVLFPKKEDIKEDFTSYHLGQQSSKLLPLKTEWSPLRWFHPGVDILLPVSLLVILMLKMEFRQALLLKILLIVAITSMLAYHFIVPKFLVANGNRFLATSFLFFALFISFTVIFIWEKVNKNLLKKALLLMLVVWVLVPIISPPLALLSKTRFGENKLIPKLLDGSPAILWLKDNANFSERIMVLDKNAPHPSGQVRALVEAGVFAPVFDGSIRAFTIEASPQYLDIAYLLSPSALSKLGISTLLIDNDFYQTLPRLRQDQLENEKYFKKVFDYSNNRKDWEKVYIIQDEYLKSGKELDGTLDELSNILPKRAKIYIDNEENFKHNFLRRPIIFILRDRDLYFNPQSGVYLNVEANINQKSPDEDAEYNYLVLGKKANPLNICKCETNSIWTGLNGQVYLYKTKYPKKDQNI